MLSEVIEPADIELSVEEILTHKNPNLNIYIKCPCVITICESKPSPVVPTFAVLEAVKLNRLVIDLPT